MEVSLPTQNQGYIHLYTGEGKGKTTAAFGLALRAAGANKHIFIGQFAKGKIYSEIKAIDKFIPNITTEQYGLDCFIEHSPGKEDIASARKGLENIRSILKEDQYDMVILDEACIALLYRLFSLEELIEVIKSKPLRCELIITGRYAPYELIQIADVVTHMQETKHYFRIGVGAREGIEY